jgi:hypothetical protein
VGLNRRVARTPKEGVENEVERSNVILVAKAGSPAMRDRG